MVQKIQVKMCVKLSTDGGFIEFELDSKFAVVSADTVLNYFFRHRHNVRRITIIRFQGLALISRPIDTITKHRAESNCRTDTFVR